MGKHILVILIMGLLVFSVSAALAEDNQSMDQDMLNAQMEAQGEFQDFIESTDGDRNSGKQVLTDEDLEEVSAAGWRFSIITNQNKGFAVIGPCGILASCGGKSRRSPIPR